MSTEKRTVQSLKNGFARKMTSEDTCMDDNHKPVCLMDTDELRALSEHDLETIIRNNMTHFLDTAFNPHYLSCEQLLGVLKRRGYPVDSGQNVELAASFVEALANTACPSKPAADGTCHFFKIPPELRLVIYAWVYGEVRIRVNPQRDERSEKMREIGPTLINVVDKYNFLVCKEWHQEVAPVIYAKSRFEFPAGPIGRKEVNHDVLGITSLSPCTANIRSIRFSLCQMGEQWDEENVKVVTACPALSKIVVRFDSSNWTTMVKVSKTAFEAGVDTNIWDAIARAKVARVSLGFDESITSHPYHDSIIPRSFLHKRLYEDVMRQIRERVELPDGHELGAHCPIVDWDS